MNKLQLCVAAAKPFYLQGKKCDFASQGAKFYSIKSSKQFFVLSFMQPRIPLDQEILASFLSLQPISQNNIEDAAVLATEMASRLDSLLSDPQKRDAMIKTIATPQCIEQVLNCLEISTSQSCLAAFAFFIQRVTLEPETRTNFTHNRVRDALLRALALATSGEPLRRICCAIGNICVDANPEGQMLFTTDASFTAVANAFKQIKTSDDVSWVCLALANICGENHAGGRLFSNVQIRDAIVASFEYATTSAAVGNLCRAIGNMTQGSPECLELFSTPAIWDLVIISLTRAPDIHVQFVLFAITQLCFYRPDAKERFSQNDAVNAVISSLKHATSSFALRYLGSAVGNICAEHPPAQRVYFTSEVRSFFLGKVNELNNKDFHGFRGVYYALAYLCYRNANHIAVIAKEIEKTKWIDSFLTNGKTSENIVWFSNLLNEFWTSDSAKQLHGSKIVGLFPELLKRIISADGSMRGDHSRVFSKNLQHMTFSTDGRPMFANEEFIRSLQRFRDDVDARNPEMRESLAQNYEGVFSYFRTETISKVRQLLEEQEMFFDPSVIEYDATSDQVLGSGAFSKVVAGVINEANNPRQRSVAVKLAKPGKLLESCIEARNCFNYRHPNIVNFIGAIKFDSELPLLFEMAESNLRQRLRRDVGLPLHQIYNVLLQITSALAFLHSRTRRVLHLDVKPENILVFANGTIFKLADLGANVRETENDSTAVDITTLFYAPPEHNNRGSWRGTTQFDVFSVGIVALELSSGKSPEVISGMVKSNQQQPELQQILQISEDITRSELWKLILKCCSVDSQQRPECGMTLLQNLKDCCRIDLPNFDFGHLGGTFADTRTLFDDDNPVFNIVDQCYAGNNHFAVLFRKTVSSVEGQTQSKNASAEVECDQF
jgi:hypothetical protein